MSDTATTSMATGPAATTRTSGDAADPRFTLLYDHECPFCRLEVAWLLRRRGDRLEAVDIAAADFDATQYGLTQRAVEEQLHGIRADGSVTVGMESVRASYEAAGVGWMMAWTRWPLVRWAADLGYRIFARYRVPMGRAFGRSCDDGACELPASRRPRAGEG